MRMAVTNIIFPNRYFVETVWVIRRLGRAEANCVIHFQSLPANLPECLRSNVAGFS